MLPIGASRRIMSHLSHWAAVAGIHSLSAADPCVDQGISGGLVDSWRSPVAGYRGDVPENRVESGHHLPKKI